MRTLIHGLILFVVMISYGCKADEFSLKVFGTYDAVDSSIYINDKLSGKLEKFDDRGSYFGIWLPYGTYKIIIKKEGYAIFEREINIKMGSEYYMDVELNREK